MNKRIRLVGLVFGSLLVAGGAQATGVQIHGSQFDNYNGNQSTCPERYVNGIRTNCSFNTSLMLGLIKLDSTTAVDVWVDGSHSGTQTTSLTTYAYSYNGVLRASRASNATSVSGNWARLMSFTAAEQTYYGYMSVLAVVPASYNGMIYGVGVYNI